MSWARAGAMTVLRLFLCGDVMTGRGIDRVLPHAGDPRLHESWAASAEDYVELAERAHGAIPRPVGFDYVWGDALAELARARPHARIGNLETSVTRSDDCWPGKDVHYRMHPDNLPCLVAAGFDCLGLANNHVLDWGHGGLRETLHCLRDAGLRTAGAGTDAALAEAPAVIDLGGTARIVVLAAGSESSGIPPAWAATPARPGVHLLADLDDAGVDRLAALVASVKRPGDVVVASLHWGSNWGFAVPARDVRFAHALIERAGVDLVHGHSSHHVRPIEVFRDKLILYGCGDFLDDYEGIAGHEEFRDDLVLMYVATVEAASGRLRALEMTPMQIRSFRLRRAAREGAEWLAATLARESRRFGTGVVLRSDGRLELRPSRSARPRRGLSSA